MELLLVGAAIVPVLLLCAYINAKDIHKEPSKLLISLFVKGALICVPVIIVEVLLGSIFETEDPSMNILFIFINIFISIALVEEGFKWLVAHGSGYKSREFDEIYDIIVYSVFASLGFACIENIGYVLMGGLSVAILRALLSIPGHACFGVLMGYYMSKAKVSEMNGQQSLYKKNMILSIIIPTLFHAIYDTLLSTDMEISMIIFFIFDIFMVVYCFGIVKKMSKVQQNITTNIAQGYIIPNNMGTINYMNPNISNFNYCPICGRRNEGFNYCSCCGFKLK